MASPASPPAGASTSVPTSPAVGFDEPAAPEPAVIATARVAEVVVRAEPADDGLEQTRLAHPVATGAPLVFGVIGDHDGPWLQVRLPVRPNGSTGWIRAADVDLAVTHYRLAIDVSDRRLTLYRGEVVVLEAPVAIGTGATPTPIGEFYLTELLQPADPTGPYGTYAYGLSGFSETLEEFNGGEGVVGIHGTNDPASLGTEVSHGCVRLHNDVIDQLVELLPLGTPVAIAA